MNKEERCSRGIIGTILFSVQWK